MVNPKRKFTAQQKFEIVKAGLLSGAGVCRKGSSLRLTLVNDFVHMRLCHGC